MTLHPSNLGNTNQNWIGRSQYGDPFLNATVDDFQIYSRALSHDRGRGAGRRPGGRRRRRRLPVRRGRRGHRARLVGQRPRRDDHPARAKPTITCPGKVFLQQDLTTGNLVCWKDQQNFAPFIDGIPPNTDEYKQALRYYADQDEFPLMPVYTANQADQAADVACAAVQPGQQQLLQHQRHAAGPAVLQGAARLPVAVHHPGHVPAADRVAVLERVHQRRQPVPRQQRVLLQLEPDHQDARPLRHPPRRARLVQLDDLPGRRGPAGRASTTWSSCGRSTWATTTSPSTTSATTAAT